MQVSALLTVFLLYLRYDSISAVCLCRAVEKDKLEVGELHGHEKIPSTDGERGFAWDQPYRQLTK
jgi:hypothetical protein